MRGPTPPARPPRPLERSLGPVQTFDQFSAAADPALHLRLGAGFRAFGARAARWPSVLLARERKLRREWWISNKSPRRALEVPAPHTQGNSFQALCSHPAPVHRVACPHAGCRPRMDKPRRTAAVRVIEVSSDRPVVERLLRPKTGKATAHVHRDWTQRFEVVEGEARIRVSKEARVCLRPVKRSRYRPGSGTSIRGMRATRRPSRETSSAR